MMESTSSVSSEGGQTFGGGTNNLATLVPTFDPAKDDLQTYQQKVELLCAAWPEARFGELATRLVLNTAGTAFQKLQQHQTEVTVNDKKAVRRIIELLGGTWGQIPLERRFESAEKALFRCQQKSDESNDSYIARSEVLWQDLLSKDMKLEELQAYVILRGSQLSPEDKKRVILDSDASAGKLEMPKVQSAIRMLGAGFFHEMVSGKKANKYKTYDNTALFADDSEEHEETYHVQGEDGAGEDEFLEALTYEGDDDALLITEFEQAAQDLVQEDPGLANAFTAYTEARRRLSEKFRHRGFFPVGKGKSKFSGKGFKGKGGKSSFRDRKPLAQRILRSQCRKCLQFGHWKDECPNQAVSSSSSTTTSNVSGGISQSGSFTGTAVTQVPSSLPLEFLNLQEFAESTLDDHLQSIQEPCLCFGVFDIFRGDGCNYVGDKHRITTDHQNSSSHVALMHLRKRRQPIREPIPHRAVLSEKPHFVDSCDDESEVYHAVTNFGPNFGILDTGATKTVIGSNLIKPLLDSLDSDLRKQVRRGSCEVTFRFGNLDTLESKQALIIPIGKMHLKVAIVPGNTPFLLSNTLVRALKADIHSDKKELHSPLFQNPLALKLSSKGLFMIDVNQLSKTSRGSPGRSAQETYVITEGDENKQAADRANMSPSMSGSPISPCHDSQHQNQSIMSSEKCVQTPSISVKSIDCDRKVKLSNSHPEVSGRSDPRDVVNHVVGPSLEEHPDSRQWPSGRHEQVQHGPARTDDGRVWEHSQREEFHRSVGQSSKLDQMVHGALSQQCQGGTSQNAEVHRAEGGTPRDGRNIGSFDRWSSECGARERWSDDGQVEGQSQAQVDGRATNSTNSDVRRDRTMGGGSCNELCREGAGGDSRGSASAQVSHAEHRECAPDNHGSSASNSCTAVKLDRVLSASPEWHLIHAGDIDVDCQDDIILQSITDQSERSRFQRLVRQLSHELEDCLSKNKPQGHKSSLLFEVFCSDRSQLSQQCMNLGGHTQRFGITRGDLRESNGRHDLFVSLARHRPRHLWFSPECKPWCAFSELNASKSMQAFATIQNLRQEHLVDLALGVVLLRYQRSCQNHFHWEQPNRSLMFRNLLLREVFQHTQSAQFDMCVLGNLQDPDNNLRMKKGMQVLTTSQRMYHHLHGHMCPGNHEHQRIEGNTWYQGKAIARTKFTELYPRKFARSVAKTMLTDFGSKPIGDSVLVTSHEPSARAHKQSRSSGFRAKPSIPRAVDPAELPEMKRRRISGKTTVVTSDEWKSCFEQIDRITPRVGKKIIRDSDVISALQPLMPDKVIQFVITCRGTDRALGPGKVTVQGEAPFRRCLFKHRESGSIFIDDQWEQWESLSQAQIQRKSHPCKLNITIFASNPVRDDHNQSQLSSSISTDSRTETVGVPSMSSEFAETRSNPLTTAAVTPSVEKSEIPHVVDFESEDHGPRFRELSLEDRKNLIRAHKNLGHPSNEKLSVILRQQGCSSEMTSGVLDMRCSVCHMHARPKHSRPGTVKEDLDFNDRIAIDGLKFTNSQGQVFHIYHIIDLATSFHVASIAPSRTAESVIQSFIQMWLCWAGPPCEIVMDSATEFVSETFRNFLQSHNIRSITVPPEGHWQNGRCERHGAILEEILRKVDVENQINSYSDLQKVLWHATQAKNSCGLRKGFSPEMLVFGKSARLPGSLSGDDALPAHSLADDDTANGVRFREHLALRESARRAFHAADNSAALRRAVLRRSCPHRGKYQSGEWIMTWKSGVNQKGWHGPFQVVTQEGDRVVWMTQGDKLLRSPPEMCRPVSAFEARSIVSSSPSDMIHRAREMLSSESRSISQSPADQPISLEPVTEQQDVQPGSISGAAVESQPDQEPEIVSTPSETPEQDPEPIPPPEDGVSVPVPVSSDEETNCVGFYCVDDYPVFTCDTHKPQAWRFEIEIGSREIDQWRSEDDPSDMAFVVSAAKRQRSEVRLSDLTESEWHEFQDAKQSEIKNWLKRGTVIKMLKNQLSPEEILRCRWVLTWKPIEASDRDPSHPDKVTKAKARLVVLGYLDPNLENIPRDSPTLGRHSKMLLLQLVASCSWDLRSFDIKAAFLQGKPQDDRIIGLEPCPELRQALALKDGEICRLVKSAYGLIDAPFLWYQALSSELVGLGFEISPFDPCLFV